MHSIIVLQVWMSYAVHIFIDLHIPWSWNQVTIISLLDGDKAYLCTPLMCTLHPLVDTISHLPCTLISLSLCNSIFLCLELLTQTHHHLQLILIVSCIHPSISSFAVVNHKPNKNTFMWTYTAENLLLLLYSTHVHAPLIKAFHLKVSCTFMSFFSNLAIPILSVVFNHFVKDYCMVHGVHSVWILNACSGMLIATFTMGEKRRSWAYCHGKRQDMAGYNIIL